MGWGGNQSKATHLTFCFGQIPMVWRNLRLESIKRRNGSVPFSGTPHVYIYLWWVCLWFLFNTNQEKGTLNQSQVQNGQPHRLQMERQLQRAPAAGLRFHPTPRVSLEGFSVLGGLGEGFAFAFPFFWNHFQLLGLILVGLVWGNFSRVSSEAAIGSLDHG